MKASIVSIATHVGSTINEFGAAVEPYYDEIEMGVCVAKKVMEKRPPNTCQISAIIFASAGIRHIFPSAAAAIGERLGLTCSSFDITAGCAAMGQAIELASNMDGLILVISADNLSKTISSAEPNHFALRKFADGAVALLVSSDGAIGHRILATNGQTHAFCHQYYGSENGIVKRNLPVEIKPKLSEEYLNAWASITHNLLNECPNIDNFEIFCNQGDQKIFKPLAEKLKMPQIRINQTGHGHAGGADPWIGLITNKPPNGSYVILLSSGIGFHFHGILLEIRY